MEYPKTENLYVRDKETNKLVVGEFKVPELAQVGKWLVTEKIDGTNIRLECTYEGSAGSLDGDDFGAYSVYLKGRSDDAVLPKNFEAEALPENWPARLITALHALCGHEPGWRLTVYGEGYGPGIQKVGAQYAPKKSLRIFDVVTQRQTAENDTRGFPVFGKPFWRPWADVERVAEILGLKTVPVIIRKADLRATESFVISEILSETAREETGAELLAEGVVARTDPYLFLWNGHRAMFKLKARDLPEPDTVEGT